MKIEEENPIWSVMIPVYNGSKYIGETIKSVLNADYDFSKMEICVIDNCSTDNTLNIVRQIAGDRIKIVVNERNVGLCGNLNRCVELSRGKYLHILHADDLVLPNFYKVYEDTFEKQKDVYLLSSRSYYINEKSEQIGESEEFHFYDTPSNDIEYCKYLNVFTCPTIVVKRCVYNKIGPFNEDLMATDWIMWVLVTREFKAMHLNQMLSCYRWSPEHTTSNIERTARNLYEIEKVYLLFESKGIEIDRDKAHETLKNYATSQLNRYITLNDNEACIANYKFLKKYLSVKERIVFKIKFVAPKTLLNKAIRVRKFLYDK